MKYLFDVDGTLTPNRSVMDSEFKKFFLEFCLNNKVYLVTGSDREKTIEQVGISIYNACQKVYQCSGNAIYRKDKLLYMITWLLTSEEKKWFKNKARLSKFLLKDSRNCIETRHGLYNFTVIGRFNKYNLVRNMYNEWDSARGERKNIVNEYNAMFDNVACIGGKVSIDIVQKDRDKSQILKDFNLNEILYFGDRMHPGGNDYPIKKILGSKAILVLDWKHTRELLNE